MRFRGFAGPSYMAMKRKAGRMPVASKESRRSDGVFGHQKHKLANLKTNLIFSPPDSELSQLIFNGSEPITGLRPDYEREREPGESWAYR